MFNKFIFLIFSAWLFITVYDVTKENLDSVEAKEPLIVEKAPIHSSSDFNTDIPFNAFVKKPKANIGIKTMFVAKVFQIVESKKDSYLMQYMVTVTPDPKTKKTATLLLEKNKLDATIHKDDEIRVWVQSLGEFSYRTTKGLNKDVPAFNIHNYEIVHK